MQSLKEDIYWEWFREQQEKVNSEPYLEKGLLFLNEEIEELEAEYGCLMENMYESDLEEIVYRLNGVKPESAKYNRKLDCIVYEYYKEAS